MRELLDGPGAAAFEAQGHIRAIESSYAARRYGSLLYALARVLRPTAAVEIGVYQGFSLLSLAAAIRDNGAGHVTGYDLFEAYPYRRAEQARVRQTVAAAGLEPWASLVAADAFTVHERWPSVDLLHVDISNTGDTYRRIFSQWASKVRAVIALEGGSHDRDRVAWMIDYAMPPIVPAVAELRRAYPDWSFVVLEPFPSMTIAVNRAARPVVADA